MLKAAAVLLACLMLQGATPGGATFYSGDELKAAQRAGFEAGDPLRIWVKGRD